MSKTDVDILVTPQCFIKDCELVSYTFAVTKVAVTVSKRADNSVCPADSSHVARIGLCCHVTTFP